MLRIALCDDEAGQRAATEELLRSYLRRPGAPAGRLSVFSSPEELLETAEEEGDFQVYILDVVMPGCSGVELGKQLRAMGCAGVIIYLSVSAEYALDSYQAQAFYYLLKPVEPESLFQVLDQALAAMEKRKASCVTVKTKQSLRLLRLDHIMCAELAGRSIRYYMAGGEQVDSVTVRRSFPEEMAPLLVDDRFLLCGASFVVNLYYVTAVGKGFLLLDGERRVPLARGSSAAVRQRWKDYWLDGRKEAALWKS